MRISDWSSDVCSSDLPCRRSSASAANRPTARAASTAATSPPASGRSSLPSSRPAASRCRRASSIPTTFSTEAAMGIEPIYLLYGAVFLAVLLLVEGAYYLFMGSALSKRTNRRLTMLNAGMESREVLELLRRQPSRRGEQPSLLIHPIVWLGHLIARSGVQITLRGTLTTMLRVAVIPFLAPHGALPVGAVSQL